MHIAEIIITLLLALAFILLGLFNPAHMDIDLFGLKSLSLPPALLTFSFFLLGAAYVAFWTLFDRFRKQLVINRLNGRVKELEEKLINEEKLMNKEQSPEGNRPSKDIEKPQSATSDLNGGDSEPKASARGGASPHGEHRAEQSDHSPRGISPELKARDATKAEGIDVTEDETAGAVSQPRKRCGTASQPQEAETINCTEEAK